MSEPPPKIVRIKLRSRNLEDPGKLIEQVAKKFPNADEYDLDISDETLADEVLETQVNRIVGEMLDRLDEKVQEEREPPPTATDAVPPPAVVANADSAAPIERLVPRWKTLARLWTVARWFGTYLPRGWKAAATVTEVPANVAEILDKVG